MTKRNRTKNIPSDSTTTKTKPLVPGSSKHGRLLWDSYYKGTYKKAEHGPLL